MDDKKNIFLVNISDDSFIKLPLFSENSNEEEMVYDYIPFSSYYYDALELCVSESRKIHEKGVVIRAIQAFRDNLYKIVLCCDDNNFDHFKLYSLNGSQCIKNMVSGDIIDNGLVIIQKDNDFIDSEFEEWCQNNGIDINRLNKNINCIALAYPISKKLRNSTNSFFSLSGASKDYSGSLVTGWSLRLHKEYFRVQQLITYFFKYKFIECHLEDEAIRYTKIDRRKQFKRINCNGTLLKKPVTLKSDYKYFLKHKSLKALRQYYSCCERKIINKMDFVNLDYQNLKSGVTIINKLSSYVFKVKYEPCRMCRPSLIGCYSISNSYSSVYNTIYYLHFAKHIECQNVSREPLIVVKNR